MTASTTPTIVEVSPFLVEFEWTGDPGNYFFDYRSGRIPVEVSVFTSGISDTDGLSLSLSDPFYEELFLDFELEKGFQENLFSFVINPNGDYLGGIPSEPISIIVSAIGGNSQTVQMNFIEQ